jgi:shikimate dehydrogenase
MMIQQVPLYLEFFGFHEAAQALRHDATMIRELIYPAELAHEIKRTRDQAGAVSASLR